ncbi:hypothetical protein KPL39_06910 [Clostridium gasigenes]|uniref:hypothetical protein n=1 Tax=Clostridium gasigenes TaxID=94869 RepID=UPI001C0E56DC|nr:hypothetical protein [Clostridium gasigenes]MBU3135995.1 hypothetical protein [Clostridium gasigenes]
MNFLLNKIDTDLRRKVYEKTRDGKIHRKSKIAIYKDSEKNRKKTFEDYIKEDLNKEKIIIEATKDIKPDIEIKAEKKADKNISSQGSFLDVKK